MDFFLKFKDLKPEAQAEIHYQIMEAISGGKHPEHLPDPYFMEVSNKADEIIKQNLEIIAHCEIEE